MSDFLSIGASAVNVYRQAIATTSNNIANVNTEGYSKQGVNVGESYPTQIASYFIGTGSTVNSIQRSYDEFVERSLRDSASDLQATTPFIEYTNRIVDIMGSETANLTNAIEAFFNASRSLSVDPGSIPLRNEVVSSGQALASRFNTLSTQIDAVGTESRDRLGAALEEVNNLAGQLLSINKQLGRNSEKSKQPPQLMDQRDLILRKLSSLSTIGVTESSNGQVSVNFGGAGRGFEIVTPSGVREIAMVSDSADPTGDVQLVIDPRGSKQPLPLLSGGEVGGLLTFRNEVAKVARDGLDHIAVQFANKVNEVHRQGFDLNGDFGQDFFRITPSYSINSEAVSGTFSVDVKVVDQTDLPTDPTKMMYRESTQSWLVYTDSQLHPEAELSVANNFSFRGLALSISGTPEDADTIILSPKNRAADTFTMELRDPRRVAASEPMTLMPAPANSSDVSAALSYLLPSERSSGFDSGARFSQLVPNLSSNTNLSLTTSSVRPAIVIDANTSAPTVVFDIGPNSDQLVQVLTAESVHLAGTVITGSEAAQLVASDAGFNAGAAYNSEYLNQTGSNAYLDTAVRLGAIGKTITEVVPEIDSASGDLLSRQIQLPPAISSKVVPSYTNSSGSEVTLIDAGDLTLNGQSLGALTLLSTEALSAAKISAWLKSEISASGQTGLVVNAKTDILVASIDATQTLEINDVSIDYDVYADMTEMLTAINAVSGQTGVRAEWDSETAFRLTNAAGFEGENIVLGGTDSVTALNLSTGAYSGRLVVTGEVGEEVALTLGAGQPSDLGQIGFYTGVYVDKPLNEELAVFVTGTGSVGSAISGSAANVDQSSVAQLPASPYKLTFTSDDIYTITDTATDTVVSKRLFEFGVPIEYRGTSISFSEKPKKGDEFSVSANASPGGNNKNILALIEWSKRPIISGQTFSEAYLDLVSGVGSRSSMSELQREALQVVYDQAYNTREESSGVNLDDEAANLIRFQQAYQAAAQVIQAAQKSFDTLLQIR
ncbi:flagellar hook-associated protein FlgK [Pseudomonadales bacterium]|nr:flagellar hook-associated protein FlgK [Pseudomonadales bacterium]